jgi:hypothetical protein
MLPLKWQTELSTKLTMKLLATTEITLSVCCNIPPLGFLSYINPYGRSLTYLIITLHITLFSTGAEIRLETQ